MTCHFSLHSQNSEYPRIFQVTGTNQSARKLLSTDLVNTYNYHQHYNNNNIIINDSAVQNIPRQENIVDNLLVVTVGRRKTRPTQLRTSWRGTPCIDFSGRYRRQRPIAASQSSGKSQRPSSTCCKTDLWILSTVNTHT